MNPVNVVLKARGSVLALAILSLVKITALARADVALWDNWEIGDLIVQQTTGPLADTLLQGSDGSYTHIGIVRPTGGGPYVMEMTPDGFWEVPVQDFIERGVDKKYAVYRYPGLTEKQGFDIMMTAFESEYAPFDSFFRIDSSAVYPSELVYQTFEKVGISLGRPLTIAEAGLDGPQGQKFSSKIGGEIRIAGRCQKRGVGWRYVGKLSLLRRGSSQIAS